MTGGSMWTVKHPLTFTLQLKEHLVEQVERMKIVLLLLLDLKMIVLELCPPAGVLARGTQTALAMGSAGEKTIQLYIFFMFYLFQQRWLC